MDCLDALLRATLAGELSAWRSLQAALEPRIHAIVRRSPKARAWHFASSTDDIRDITVAAFERLSRNGFRNLRCYHERATQASCVRNTTFDSWLHGAVEYAILDHIRKRFGRSPQQPRSAADSPLPSRPRRALLRDQEHLFVVDDPGFRAASVAITQRLLAKQVLAHVARSFSLQEAAAVRMYYLEDSELDEIARALRLPDAAAANRMIRKLNARLRYHFGRSRCAYSGDRLD
jgi:DNA-directed RNA polymerase specialized sigma24 family protein